jgi:DNA-binding beta-propeller fold protein YncE
MIQRTFVAYLLTGLVMTSVPGPVSAAGADALVLDGKIALGDVSGRIDHLAVDLARHRLFVAELGNNSVGVVDFEQQKLVHRIAGLKEPQGVAYVPDIDTIYVANAGDGFLERFKGEDFAPLGRLRLGDDADNIRVDARAHQVVIGYGKGALAIVDAGSAQKTGGIHLPAHPESFQLEKAGPRIFVNVPDARQVAVVDRSTGQQVGAWKLPDARGNFPMALDETGERLMVVYRNPAVLAVFDTRSGDVVARRPTCGDADDVFFDAKRQRIYVSCGEGFLDVLQWRGGSVDELARLPTVSGARTSLFVPDLDRLFLAVRARGSERAALWAYQPAP